MAPRAERSTRTWFGSMLAASYLMISRCLLTRFAGLGVLGAAAGPADAAWTMNLTHGVTPLSHEVWDLHMAMFAICVVVGSGVCVVMTISILRHRKSRGAVAAGFHEAPRLEIAWTVAAFLILAAVAFPAARVLVAMSDPRGADVVIDVTGHQWLWSYRYPNAGVHFDSRLAVDSLEAEYDVDGHTPANTAHYLRDVDHPMVVPVGAKVALNITSGDVIHSWWVPALGGKMDAVPGRLNHKWFRAERIGTYRGQCAELCGRGHAMMPIVVRVVSPADYRAWLTQQGGHLPSSTRHAEVAE